MRRPTRKELHEYLGKEVKIEFYDNDVLTGQLKVTDHYGRGMYYRLDDSFLFRVSHIRNIKRSDGK